jgi:hypothetical protein
MPAGIASSSTIECIPAYCGAHTWARGCGTGHGRRAAVVSHLRILAAGALENRVPGPRAGGQLW